MQQVCLSLSHRFAFIALNLVAEGIGTGAFECVCEGVCVSVCVRACVCVVGSWRHLVVGVGWRWTIWTKFSEVFFYETLSYKHTSYSA